MVLAGLGLNPAGVSLFRMHAPQSPLTSAWGLNPARVCHGFALLLTVSQMLFRQPVWGRSDYPLGLNPAEVSLFRLWLQCAGVSLFVVALLGFSLLVVASSFCFFRPSERNVREFYGGWFWQVWAWILLGFPCFACMPHRALWLPLEAWILPGFAMVLLCF